MYGRLFNLCEKLAHCVLILNGEKKNHRRVFVDKIQKEVHTKYWCDLAWDRSIPGLITSAYFLISQKSNIIMRVRMTISSISVLTWWSWHHRNGIFMQTIMIMTCRRGFWTNNVQDNASYIYIYIIYKTPHRPSLAKSERAEKWS